MHRRQLMFGTIVSLLAVSYGYGLHAQDHKDDRALIKSMGAAKITLQQALTAAAQEGQPISAKFEVEDGKLQLSVYTAKDGKFSEVIVDHATGKVAKTEAITEGDDFAEAQSQSAAMGKSKSQLKDAVDKATRRASGSRAVDS